MASPCVRPSSPLPSKAKFGLFAFEILHRRPAISENEGKIPSFVLVLKKNQHSQRFCDQLQHPQLRTRTGSWTGSHPTARDTSFAESAPYFSTVEHRALEIC